MRTAYQWLLSGRTPFRSVIIDSLSEVQQRCVDSTAGTSQLTQQAWGDLLRQMSSVVRLYRDLATHPTHPLAAVVLVAMTRVAQTGQARPLVQGQLATTLPYYIDVVGFMAFAVDAETGTSVRRLWVVPSSAWDAGDRTGVLGTHVDNPNLTEMLNQITTTMKAGIDQ